MIFRLLRVAFSLVLLFVLLAVAVLAAWEHSFPATVSDRTAATRTYYPALLGYGGTALVNAGYIAASGLDTNMQIGTSSITYTVGESQVVAVLPNLPSGGQVTATLYTGYTPNQVDFPIAVGNNGYVSIADAAALEPGNNFEFEHDGYVVTSGALNGVLLYKRNALAITATEGNIAAGIGTPAATISSNNDDGSFEDASGSNWIAQTFTVGGTGIVTTEVRPYLSVVAPATRGNVTVSLRATSGGLPTGNDLASVSVPGVSIPGGGFVNFYLTAYLSAGTTYAMVLRYPQGNGAIRWHAAATDPYAGGQKATSTDSGATWTAVAGTDMRFQGVYSFPIMVSDAKASADYGVKVSADTVNLELEIDSGAGYVLEDSIALGGNTVPNNANTWYLMQGNVMPYQNFYKHTVGGVEIVEYQPNTMLTALATASAVEFPTIVTSSSGTNVSGTAHTLSMPASLGFGNLLIAILATTSNPTITWPTGWTSLFATSQGVNNTLAAAYRVAVGNETSISVTTSTAQTSSYQVLRIAYYQGVPVVGVAATGAGAANPDPPNLTSGWGAVNTLWIAVAEDSVNITGTPANYIHQVLNGTTPYLNTAYYQLSAASNNPGTFTAAAGNWVANTIAVEVANPAEVVDLDGGDQDGTLTWGYNTGLAVGYGGMTSYESTSAVAAGVVGFSPPSASMPSTWFATGTGAVNLPFYDSFNYVSGQTGMPVQTLYFWFIIGIAFGTALLLMVFTRSALFGVMGMTVVLFIGSSQTIVPMWIPFAILVVDLAILYLYRQVSY